MVKIMEAIIVTGLSGAGKSNAMNYLEDMGYYCIDNMPPALLESFITLEKQNRCLLYTSIYEEKQIGLHYLIRSDHGRYAREAAACRADGIYHDAVLTDPQEDIPLTELCIPGCMNPRRLVDAAEYRQSCIRLSERIMEAVSLRDGEKILVLGTEECMYPALHLAEMLEEKGYSVKNHATTRSPIVVSREASYPLHSRYQLASLYDGRRKTFIYDLEPVSYTHLPGVGELVQRYI